MKIESEGSDISFGENDDLYDVLHNVKCVCGHELYRHGSRVSWTLGIVYGSLCTARGCNCDRFKAGWYDFPSDTASTEGE